VTQLLTKSLLIIEVKTLPLLTTCCLLFLLACCKKEEDPKPKPSYTIQGKIYQAYPTIPYVRQSITVTVTRGGNIGGFKDTYVSKDLATAITNDSGWFSVTYPATDITGSDPGGNAQIHISSQFFQFDGLPVNQNINQNFFPPSAFGKVELYLQTNNSLELSHDTLFLGFIAGNVPVIDTITKSVNGLYKKYTAPSGGFTMFYSRGGGDKWYNKNYKRFTYYAKEIDTQIDGNPIVNKMTINY
jgi:hypothetical protein